MATPSNVVIPATGSGTATPSVECAQVASDGVSVRQVVQVGSFGDNNTSAEIAAGNGTTNSGTQRVTISSDSTGSVAPVAQGSTTSGQTGPLIQAAVTTAAPTYSNAQTSPLSLDSAGNLRVNVVTGGAGGGSGAVYGATVVGSPAANPPILLGGTANAGATGTVQIAKVDSSGNFYTQASQAGTWNITNVSGTVSLPTGAATSALQTTINSTLGSPFQAGGSIGNTAFGATQSGTWTVGISAAQTIAVTNTGTFATQATQSGTWNIGTVTTLTGITPAFGATSSSVPASSGYQGLRGTTANPTAVTDGQMVGAQGDKEGRLTTVPYAVRDLAGQQKTTISASTAETTIVTAVASTFLDILSFNFSNTGATATKVDIRDTTGGSIVATFMVPAGDMRGQTYTLPFKQTTVNTNWTAQCASSTTAMEITVQYVKNI